MRPGIPSLIIALILAAGLFGQPFAAETAPQKKLALADASPTSGPMVIQNGTLVLKGKPFIKRGGWFGVNTWLSNELQKTRGYFLAIPTADVGTAKDYYTSGGLNDAFFTVDTMTSPSGTDFTLLDECLTKASKAGLTVTLNISMDAPSWLALQNHWCWVNEDGTTITMQHGIHYDPVEYKRVMRQFLTPIIDHIRDNDQVGDYQLSGETYAYNPYESGQSGDLSYDPVSIARFRTWLAGRFTLAQLSQRWGNRADYFSSFSAVQPPRHGGQGIPNADVAVWDWYKYKKSTAADCFSALIELIQELDGRSRPIFYEYNHCPETDTRLFPWQQVAATHPGFNLCDGDFAPRLSQSLYYLALIKETSAGPWPNNELDGGSPEVGSFTVDTANIRRHIWFNLACGTAGYNFWAFPNVIGAPTEMSVVPYIPSSPDQLPPRYWETKRANQMIDALGPLLAGSVAPARDMGLIFLDESTFNWRFIISYFKDTYSLFDALLARGFADRVGVLTEYQLEHQDLSRFKVLILPQTPRLLDSHAQALAGYVNAGGTLVLMGDTARVDELFHDTTPLAVGGLNSIAGIQVAKYTDVRGLPAWFFAGGQPVNCDILTRITLPAGSTATVIGQTLPARVDKAQSPLPADGLQGATNLVTAATKNQYGKGTCYYLAGKPFLTDPADPTGGFIEKILTDAGVQPGAHVTEDGKPAAGVAVSRRDTATSGSLLFLIENEDRAHHLSIQVVPKALGLDASKTYNVFECFSSESHTVSAANGWSFETDLEPVGVRIHLITQAATLDKVLPANKQIIVPREPQPATVLDEHAAIQNQFVTDAAQAQPQPPISLGERFMALDLKGFVNTPISAVFGDDTPLTASVVTQGSIPARVAHNGASGLLKIKASGVTAGPSQLPRTVKGLKVSLTGVEKIHFFDGAEWSTNQEMVARYVVHYQDGTSLVIPVVDWMTSSDLLRGTRQLGRYETIWSGANANKETRFLYRSSWVNPYPEKLITSLDIEAYDDALIIWAITLEGDRMTSGVKAGRAFMEKGL